MAVEAKDIARVALGCISDKKGFDVKVIDVGESSVLADYFVIASVDNKRQSKAILTAIEKELKSRGTYAIGVEGREEGWWILIDYGSVVIHIQHTEARAYYDLDSYWGDCPQVDLEPIAPSEAA